MKFTTITLASMAVISAVSAFPFIHLNQFAKRDGEANNTKEKTALSYALAYETLLSNFYQEGLTRFDRESFKNAGYTDRVYDEFLGMQYQDTAQVSAIESATIAWTNGTNGTTQDPPVCEYNFNWSDVNSFIKTARYLEQVGVSAYLGQFGNLNGNFSLSPNSTNNNNNNNTHNLNTTTTLTGNYPISQAVAEITTVDARNSAFLNWLSNGTATPYALDTALTPAEVLTIAQSYIINPNCTASLKVEPYTPLNVSLPVNGTGTVSLDYNNTLTSRNATFCQFLYGSMISVRPIDNCSLPEGVRGYVYVYTTDSAVPVRPVKDGSNIVAGPGIAFNDAYNASWWSQ